MALFKPGWQSRNEAKALRSVEKLKDDAARLQAARDAELASVKIRAAALIEAPAMLLELAVHAWPESVCETAVKKLSDPDMLTAVALHSASEKARTAAVDKLRDQAALARIALEGERPYTQEKAVRRLTNRDVLQKLALTGRSSVVRLAAAEQLNDSALLEQMALADASDTVRLEVTRRVKDEDALVRIALGDNKKVSLEAASRLSSPQALERVARNTSDWQLAHKLVDRLKDEEALMRLAMEAKDDNARHHAASRIRSREKAKAILLKCKDSYTGSPLWSKLISTTDLIDIAEQAECSDIREMAVSSIYKTEPEAVEKLAAEGCREANDLIVKRRGGYTCAGCGRAFYPVEGTVPPCICPDCGTENHDFHHKSDIHEYRDYEVGSVWDECSRCGKKINYRSIHEGYLE